MDFIKLQATKCRFSY